MGCACQHRNLSNGRHQQHFGGAGFSRFASLLVVELLAVGSGLLSGEEVEDSRGVVEDMLLEEVCKGWTDRWMDGWMGMPALCMVHADRQARVGATLRWYILA